MLPVIPRGHDDLEHRPGASCPDGLIQEGMVLIVTSLFHRLAKRAPQLIRIEKMDGLPWRGFRRCGVHGDNRAVFALGGLFSSDLQIKSRVSFSCCPEPQASR